MQVRFWFWFYNCLCLQKLQEEAFPRKDELKKRLQEKYSWEHGEYLRAQVSVHVRVCECAREGFLFLIGREFIC